MAPPLSNLFAFQPPSVFLDPNGYSAPTGANVLSRVEANLRTFSGNYLIVVGLFLLIASSRDQRIVYSALLVALIAAVFYFFVLPRGALNVGNRRIPPEQLEIGFTVASVLLFWWVAGEHAFYPLVFGIVVSLAHAALRTNAPKTRIDQVVDQVRNAVKQ